MRFACMMVLGLLAACAPRAGFPASEQRAEPVAFRAVRSAAGGDAGSVRSSIRFVIKGTRGLDLARYWLSFQLHGSSYSQRAARWVDDVRWIHDSSHVVASRVP